MLVLRISLGLVLLACYAMRLAYVPELYGPEGFAGPAYTAPLELERPLSRNLLAPFYVLQHVNSPTLVGTLYALLLASSLAFAAGAFTRWSGSAALLLHLTFYARNPWAYWGWAEIITPLLLYTILAPSGRQLSFDAWRRRRRSGEPAAPVAAWSGPAWPLRLVQIHVCTQYLALWPRLDSPNWLEGRQLFAALVNRHFGRLEFDAMPYLALLEVMTVVALLLELAAPLLLWVPRVGPLWALALIGLHLQIELSSTVGWWNWALIPALTAFLPAAWLVRAFSLLPTQRPTRSRSAAPG